MKLNLTPRRRKLLRNILLSYSFSLRPDGDMWVFDGDPIDPLTKNEHRMMQEIRKEIAEGDRDGQPN